MVLEKTKGIDHADQSRFSFFFTRRQFPTRCLGWFLLVFQLQSTLHSALQFCPISLQIRSHSMNFSDHKPLCLPKQSITIGALHKQRKKFKELTRSDGFKVNIHSRLIDLSENKRRSIWTKRVGCRFTIYVDWFSMFNFRLVQKTICISASRPAMNIK